MPHGAVGRSGCMARWRPELPCLAHAACSLSPAPTHAQLHSPAVFDYIARHALEGRLSPYAAGASACRRWQHVRWNNRTPVALLPARMYVPLLLCPIYHAPHPHRAD